MIGASSTAVHATVYGDWLGKEITEQGAVTIEQVSCNTAASSACPLKGMRTYAGMDPAGSGLPNGLANRGSMTLDGLQSRSSINVEAGLASQHQSMLNSVAAAQLAASKTGSMAAMNELSDAQEAQLQNAVAEARSSGELQQSPD